jgi:two-component system, chemotaxis family, response regulator Rcp1
MGASLGLVPALKAGVKFHILVVDDDRAGAELLRTMMKSLRGRYEVYFVWDGVEALDFLHRRGAYRDAPRPNLILLDINMPRLGGLETLSEIKSDPALYVIPVIMTSSSSSLDDVRRSYRASANCYVQKPTNLKGSVKLLHAVESFWMDFALLPASDERAVKDRQANDLKNDHSTLTGDTRAGPPIALKSAEAKSRAEQEIAKPSTAGCEEHNRLLDDFGVAVRGLLSLHDEQFLAIVDGDTECSRFDLLIHMANEKKQMAKYAYLRHVEAHGCSNTNNAAK